MRDNQKLKIYQSIQDYLNDIGIEHCFEVNNFFIFKIEDYFGDSEFEMGPYKHNFFEITYGSGHDVDIKIGNFSFKPIDNSLSFSTPYHISTWKVNSFKEDSLGYMILFKPDLINFAYNKIDLYRNFPFFNLHTSPAISLTSDQSMEIRYLMETMLRESNQKGIGNQQVILSAYLTILLEKTNVFYKQSSSKVVFSNRAEEIAFLFETLLKEKVNYQLHLSDYASELNISTPYLSEAIKKATGMAAKSIAQEFLILKAKASLIQNDDTIANVAHSLGFSDTSNFIKFFKLHVGLTPNQYRKKP